MRKDRTILLCTHFLEEADALSDRILILSEGKLRANHTSKELKQLYGTGYKLVVTIQEDHHAQFLQFIEKSLPDATIESETNHQIIIDTNNQITDEFLQTLHQLDQFQENQFIDNYGISNTTLGSQIYQQLENRYPRF